MAMPVIQSKIRELENNLLKQTVAVDAAAKEVRVDVPTCLRDGCSQVDKCRFHCSCTRQTLLQLLST